VPYRRREVTGLGAGLQCWLRIGRRGGRNAHHRGTDGGTANWLERYRSIEDALAESAPTGCRFIASAPHARAERIDGHRREWMPRAGSTPPVPKRQRRRGPVSACPSPDWREPENGSALPQELPADETHPPTREPITVVGATDRGLTALSMRHDSATTQRDVRSRFVTFKTVPHRVRHRARQSPAASAAVDWRWPHDQVCLSHRSIGRWAVVANGRATFRPVRADS
jgi:hypothetical protein